MGSKVPRFSGHCHETKREEFVVGSAMSSFISPGIPAAYTVVGRRREGE